jgi:hypothetical protein
MTCEPAAILVMRAWTEGEDALRVRVLELCELRSESRTLGVAATVDDACEIVRSWLESLPSQRDAPVTDA